jgi:hypothetical protein
MVAIVRYSDAAKSFQQIFLFYETDFRVGPDNRVIRNHLPPVYKTYFRPRIIVSGLTHSSNCPG